MSCEAWSTVTEGMGDITMETSKDTLPSEANIRKEKPTLQVSQSGGEGSGAGGQEGGGTSSQPTSLSYSGDNEEEYLRATWQRLGVGHDGFLSLDELATVCHAIGMEKVANEVLEQLFSRLDVDGDGRISFEEFVHMFQSGGPSGNNSLVLDESLHQDTSMSGLPVSRMNSVGDDRRGLAVVDSSIMSALDPDNTGGARIEHIVEAWESLSISNGPGLLRELGFCQRSHERLSLRDLAAALEEDCRVGGQGDTSPPAAVTSIHLAALSYIHEVKFLRLSVECARGERDKLRQDLNEANQRLTLLAQELDEHSAQVEASTQLQIQELERQYREQVREVQEAAGREREAAREQVSAAASQALTQATQAHQEEARCKAKLSSLSSEIKRLEVENSELSEKLQETERHLSQMEKQAVQVHTLKTKVAEYESMSPREEEYRRLMERLERVMVENQQLRDNNDELLSQIDSLPARHSARSEKEISLDGSCLGDYVESGVGLSGVGLPSVGLAGPVKRRGSNSGSGDDSCEEESPRGSKVRRCSRGLNVHYVDVGSYDESFFESSMSSFLKSSPTRSLRPPSSLDPPSPAFTHSIHTVLKHVGSSENQDPSITSRDGGDKTDVTDDELTTKILSRKEVEAELLHLRRERDTLAKQLKLQEEEFTHQLEKKEFECEAAHGRQSQLEKVNKQLSQSPPKSSPHPRNSTPNKATPHTTLNEKCVQCGGRVGQLTEALEELEAALTRQDQQQQQQQHPPSHSTSGEGERNNKQDENISWSTAASTTTTSTTITTITTTTPSISTTTTPSTSTSTSPESALVQALSHSTNGVNTDAILAEKLRSSCCSLIEKIKRKRSILTPRGGGGGGETTDRQGEEEEEEGRVKEKKEEDEKDGKVEDDQQLDVKTNKRETSETPKSKNDFHILEEEITGLEEDLTRERDGLEKQRAGLLEKNSKLEQDLEILRVEFDKSEDYWSLKLQEEQDYYEEERRLYDDKFSALERKIREYEDLVLSGSGGGGGSGGGAGGGRDQSEDSDRLSTIDESAIWEKQVTELEEEVAQMRNQVEQLREERFNMERSLEVRVVEARQVARQECNSLQDQVNNLSTQLHTSQLQVTSVLEELDKVRQESEHRIQQLVTQQHDLQDRGIVVNGHGSHSEEHTPMDSLGQLCTGSRNFGTETITVSLRSQLHQCHERLKYLEGALKHHHTHANHILSVTRDQHQAEVQNLESMMVATQQMLGQHIAKYKDQLTKASRGDSLVKELYLENAQLMRALQITESRQKSAEENTHKLQMAALRPHTVS